MHLPPAHGTPPVRSARSSVSDERVFPRELQTRPSSSGEVRSASRRGSIGGQNELVFYAVPGVAYDNLDEVLGNEEATLQLQALMTARFCLENLRFLQALNALQTDLAPEHRHSSLQTLFEQWIGDQAQTQVNLPEGTTKGLLALWSSLAHEPDRAGDPDLSVLLDQARTEVERVILFGPLRELESRVQDLPNRQSACLGESKQEDEARRLLGFDD